MMLVLGVAVSVAVIAVVGWGVGRHGSRREVEHYRGEAERLMAVVEADVETTLTMWIDRIAELENDRALDAHILKHAHELETDIKQPSDRVVWLASMENLLMIYQRKWKIAATSTQRLDRLMVYYGKEGSIAPPRIVPPTPRAIAAPPAPPPPPLSYGGS